MTGNHREKILIQKSWEIILHVFHMVKPKTTHQIQWVPDFFHLSPARSQDCCPWSEIGPPYSPPPFYPLPVSPWIFWFFTDQDMAHASIPSSHLRSVSGPSSVWRRIARLSVPCQLAVRHRGFSTIECGEAWRMTSRGGTKKQDRDCQMNDRESIFTTS